MTTDQNTLADRLEELREKATPGPWGYRPDEYSDPDYTDEVSERPLGVLQSGDGKHGILGEFVTTYDLEGSGSIQPKDASLIVELVNSLPAIISALRGRESVIDWRSLGEIIHEEAQEYELRDPDHTPTDFERFMLEDFGNGIKEKLVRAALSSTSQVIAEGMVSAPEEPTDAMCTAGLDAAERNLDLDGEGTIILQTYLPKAVYRAMIKAAKGGE